MIVKMRKLSLLLYHREREAFLADLQGLGVVHVVVDPDASSDELRVLQEKMRSSERVAKALKRMGSGAGEPVAPASDLDADAVVERFAQLEADVEKLESRVQVQRKVISVLTPWGEFDPAAVDRLAERGIRTRFYETTTKKFGGVQGSSACIEMVATVGNTVHFAAFDRGEGDAIDADQVQLPKVPLGSARARLRALEGDLGRARDSMAALAAYRGVLEATLREHRSGHMLEASRLSMAEEVGGKVLALTGWVPVHREEKVVKFVEGFSAWYAMADPGPGDDVPVLLKNNKFAKMFEVITQMRSLPEYFELDPTPFFSPFFALFFGLCFADVGYGVILAALGFFARGKLPARLRSIGSMIMTLGCFTVVCGFLLNTFFGHAIFAVPGSENGYFASGAYLAPLSAVTDGARTYFPAIPFALYLGLIQLLIGMAMRAYTRARAESLVYALQPVSLMIMTVGLSIFLVKINFMDLRTFAMFAVPVGGAIGSLPMNTEWLVFGVGALLLVLFNNPDKGFGLRIPLALWEFYGFITGFMGDGLSYLRLFALGLAGGLLGSAFNQIGFMLITRDGEVHYNSFLIVGTILVMVLGHTINFGLSLIGCFVHPLRLTFVEFYKNLDFKGGAKPYLPLARQEAN